MYKIEDIYTKDFNKRQPLSFDIHAYLQRLGQREEIIKARAKKKNARLLATVNKNRKLAEIVQRNLEAGNVVKVGY